MTQQNKTKKNKKISTNTIALTLLLMVVVTYFAVRNVKITDAAQAAGITESTALLREQIKEFKKPADDLDTRLAAAQAELDAVQTGFPDTVDRNGVVKYILELADECEVQVLPLSSEGWGVENIGLQYNVLGISITTSGTLQNVKKLMTNLLAGKYPTLTITGCSIERFTGDTPGFPGDEMVVNASMRIGIYTFEKAPEEGQQP